MANSLDPWLYQNMVVAQHWGLDPFELDDWYNSDFLDAYEFVAVQNEIDRRSVAKRRDK